MFSEKQIMDMIKELDWVEREGNIEWLNVTDITNQYNCSNEFMSFIKTFIEEMYQSGYNEEK